MKFAFVIMTEFLKNQQVYTMLKMLEAAVMKGQEIVGVFFFGSGVQNIRSGCHLGKNTQNIPVQLEEFAGKHSIPMHACQTWADNMGIDENSCIKNASISGLGELSDLTAQADRLIVFGGHT